MFADPFFNLMLIVLLFFAGLLVMFIFMMRSIDSNWRNQEETRKQMALSLSDLERKLNEIGMMLRGGNPDTDAPCREENANSQTAQSPLPDLSLFTAGDPQPDKQQDGNNSGLALTPLPDILIGEADEDFAVSPHDIDSQIDSEADLALFHTGKGGEQNSSTAPDNDNNQI